MNALEFKTILEESGVIEQAENLGLSAGKIFLSAENDNYDAYKDYLWVVMPHSLDGLMNGIVIHAVPPVEKIADLPWEEWFVYNGEQRHHVLYRNNNVKCTDDVDIPENDEDHPRIVSNMRWYYYNDKNLLPVMLREE